MGIDSSDLRLWGSARITVVSGSRLWVDDLREPPDGSWVCATTSAEAIAFLQADDVAEVSLDHDLGGEDTTRRVVMWMAEHGRWPVTVQVHTANPVGRAWLVGMIDRYGPGVTT